MSILIDEMIHHCKESERKIDGKWYLLRPHGSFCGLSLKFKNAYLVLTGKACAIHFKEDELKYKSLHSQYD